jgi:hypothetical protein
MMTQDPITMSVADAIGMTVEQAELQPKTAARRAAAVLRNNGFERRACHLAWERGSRWYKSGSTIPLPDLCATSILGVALLSGDISEK